MSTQTHATVTTGLAAAVLVLLNLIFPGHPVSIFVNIIVAVMATMIVGQVTAPQTQAMLIHGDHAIVNDQPEQVSQATASPPVTVGTVRHTPSQQSQPSTQQLAVGPTQIAAPSTVAVEQAPLPTTKCKTCGEHREVELAHWQGEDNVESGTVCADCMELLNEAGVLLPEAPKVEETVEETVES